MLETRPRNASGADICRSVIWLVVNTTSEAPPTTLIGSAKTSDGLSADPGDRSAIDEHRSDLDHALPVEAGEGHGEGTAELRADSHAGEQHAEALWTRVEHILGINGQQRAPDGNQQEIGHEAKEQDQPYRPIGEQELQSRDQLPRRGTFLGRLLLQRCREHESQREGDQVKRGLDEEVSGRAEIGDEMARKAGPAMRLSENTIECRPTAFIAASRGTISNTMVLRAGRSSTAFAPMIS